jgi:crotonobetainyl-CoA:carnitine CoA-transferase CaiB-like acyl-CoA transferase
MSPQPSVTRLAGGARVAVSSSPAVRGTRVLDLSDNVAGAYAGRLLASVGAAVVLGEPPGGSPLRAAPPLLEIDGGHRSAAWEYLAACKDSVVVEPGAAVEAARGFDVVIVGSDAPGEGVAELVTALHDAHPSLVVVAVTPFGLTGPQSSWRAGPLEQWALGGQLTLNGEPDREPIPGGGAWNSHLVGATAAVAAQAALLSPAAQRGAVIDVAAQAALASAHQWSITMYTHTGVVKKRAGNRHGEMHHPLNLYECSDGWVCIAAASFHQWEGLCIAMDRVELLADDDLAGAADRFDRADEVDEAVTAWTRERTVAEVVEACQSHFCPAGPVGDLAGILADEQLVHRGYWRRVPELGADAKMPGVPFVLPGAPEFRPAPVSPVADPTSAGSSVTVRDSPAASPTDAGPADPGFAPLKGVRVVELTISWAGPLAGRFLADLGADVVKVEHPTSRGVAVVVPDPDAAPLPWKWGELPPTPVRNGMYPDAVPGVEWWNRMSLWNKMNRSKRSLCLDIKAPGGREVFERLVASADIVLNNYSPRGVRSLEIHHETLRSIKPDIVTVAMSGFGATGPGSEAVSWGPILDAASGLAATTGYRDSGPYKQGLAYPDPVGGVHGASAVLGAWWEHLRTGGPVHVDLSQLETLLSIAGDLALEASVTGRSPERRGARSPLYAPAGVYPCAGDDRWLALTVYDEQDWARLVSLVPALARPDWEQPEGRRRGHDDIDTLIAAWTRERQPHEAMAELQRAGLSAAVAATNKDLVEDPQLASRGFMVTVEQHACDPRQYPGSPFLVDGTPLPIRPVSLLGGDNAAVLAELGYDTAQQAELAASGAIATAPPS